MKKFYKPKNSRQVDGILLLDKPCGSTSNAALQEIKHLYHAKKAGHTGSLDPLASGLLPICFGEATKFSQFLLESDKTYSVTALLGVKTTTGDAEGEVILRRPLPEFRQGLIEEALSHFLGLIQQIPSMFSALKHNGQPLYKLARQGLEIPRNARPVTIYRLEKLSLNNNLLNLEVACSKGTYVRTLVEDIGEYLGCGAHVTYLRRLQVGPYRAEKMYTVEFLKTQYEQGGILALDKLLLPLESSVMNWPSVLIPENSIFYIQQGQTIAVPTNVSVSGQVRLYKSTNQKFIGVGEITKEGKLIPKRLLA